jgi:hypothetical protein
MNPRRVHEFMRERFPAFDGASKAWRNVADAQGPKLGEIASLVSEHVGQSEAIVEVHRKLGAALPAAEAVAYIGEHMGEGQIRVTNRECSGFVVIATNGAACGWNAR